MSRENDLRDFYEEESHVRVEGGLGGLASFNMEHGYLEAIVRGFKSGFLRDFEYRQLCQCGSLEDVKLTLADTDFSGVLGNQQQLTPDIVSELCWDKYVQEFRFLRDQATGQLATFMDFITYEYLISNVCFLISSLIRGSDPAELLEKCNPMGMFPRLKTVLTFENSADGLVELYRTVLIDTPVAPYFEKYFMNQLGSAEPFHGIEQAYNEMEIDVITNMLQKLWLEDFYRFTQTLGGTTAEIMKTLLEFEADRRAISITINSFNTQLNDQFARDSERKALYCNFGNLYPEGIDAFSRVGNMEQLQRELEKFPQFSQMWARGNQDGKSIEDVLYKAEVDLNRLAFESQSHFACFYAYNKLKEQERRNIWWIMSCIFEGRPARDFQRYIKIMERDNS